MLARFTLFRGLSVKGRSHGIGHFLILVLALRRLDLDIHDR